VNRTLAPLVELQLVVEEFNRHSAEAIRACEAGDDVALHSALDARELLTQHAERLARHVSLARLAARTRADRQAIDDALAPLTRAAVAAERLNAALAVQAQGARQVVGEQLDRLRHDESARSAYAAVALRGESSQLDRTR